MGGPGVSDNRGRVRACLCGGVGLGMGMAGIFGCCGRGKVLMVVTGVLLLARWGLEGLSDGLAILSPWLAVTDRLVGGGEALWMHGRVVITLLYGRLQSPIRSIHIICPEVFIYYVPNASSRTKPGREVLAGELMVEEG